MATLWARHRGEMLRRVDVVEGAVGAAREDSLEEEVRADAERAAHNIGGVAGSFGFHDASAHARELELALRNGVTAADAPRLSELVLDIRRELERDPRGRT